MMAQTRYESSSSYVQCENKVYVQTRTTVRPTNSLSRYTKRYVSVTHGLYNTLSSLSATLVLIIIIICNIYAYFGKQASAIV